MVGGLQSLVKTLRDITCQANSSQQECDGNEAHVFELALHIVKTLSAAAFGHCKMCIVCIVQCMCSINLSKLSERNNTRGIITAYHKQCVYSHILQSVLIVSFACFSAANCRALVDLDCVKLLLSLLRHEDLAQSTKLNVVLCLGMLTENNGNTVSTTMYKSETTYYTDMHYCCIRVFLLHKHHSRMSSNLNCIHAH